MSFHEKIAIDPGNSLNRDSGWIQATTLADARRLKRTEKYFSVFCGGSVPSQPIPSWCCLASCSNAAITQPSISHLLPFPFLHNPHLIRYRGDMKMLQGTCKGGKKNIWGQCEDDMVTIWWLWWYDDDMMMIRGCSDRLLFHLPHPPPSISTITPTIKIKTMKWRSCGDADNFLGKFDIILEQPPHIYMSWFIYIIGYYA